MELIDSHAHLTCDTLYEECEAIIDRMLSTQVIRAVNICTDKLTLERGLELSARHSCILNAAAATPHDVDTIGKSFFPLVEKAAKEGRLAAIGESGLDYYYEHSPKQLQQEHLKRYCRLAMETKLPLIIHCREAFNDLIAIIDDIYEVKKNRAILHCFTGTMEEAERLLDRGYFISFSGIVTFKKSLALQEVAKMVPLKHLLIETDSPYLAPQSVRGKRNEPSYLPETCRFIAGLKGIKAEELAAAAKANIEEILGSV